MHIMLDLETLGTNPGCVVVSIGAVPFDPVKGYVGDGFYRPIALKSAQEAGLTIMADTVGWWLQQSSEARGALFANPAPLAFALDEFSLWWRENQGVEVWGHGASFDPPILEAAYAAVGRRVPWRFPDVRDTRTLFDLAGVKPDRAVGVHHNARDDAHAQALAACSAYAILGKADPGSPFLPELELTAEVQADAR